MKKKQMEILHTEITFSDFLKLQLKYFRVTASIFLACGMLTTLIKAQEEITYKCNLSFSFDQSYIGKQRFILESLNPITLGSDFYSLQFSGISKASASREKFFNQKNKFFTSDEKIIIAAMVSSLEVKHQNEAVIFKMRTTQNSGKCLTILEKYLRFVISSTNKSFATSLITNSKFNTSETMIGKNLPNIYYILGSSIKSNQPPLYFYGLLWVAFYLMTTLPTVIFIEARKRKN